MKFTTTVAEFRDAYSVVFNTLDKRKDAPGAELYMQAIQANSKAPSRVLLFSSNGVALTVARLNAEVETAGAVLLYFKDLGQSTGALPPSAEVLFSAGEKRLTMRSGAFRPTCAIDTEGLALRQELLNIIPFTKAPELTVPATQLLDCLERTAAFAGGDDKLDQLYLHQVMLAGVEGAIEAYSTNTKVAAKAHIKVPDVLEGFGMEIPMHAILPLVKVLHGAGTTPVKIIVRNNESTGVPTWLYFRAGTTVFGTALMEGSLPANLKQMETMVGIPKASLQINRKELVDMLTRCMPFITSREDLSLSLTDDMLVVSDEAGEVLDELKGSGNTCKDTCSVVVSRDWVAGAAKAVKDEEVSLNFGAAKRKIIWLSGGNDDAHSFYLITTKVEAKKNLAPVKHTAVAAAEEVAA